jgi:high-affinity nickel-transport protein
MDFEFLSFSGLALMFLLGLRHGLDPDHIACIDGLTWRAVSHHSPHARSIGTLFAIGHGMLVTLIAVGVSQLTKTVIVPDALIVFFQWVPTFLLILIGTMNLGLLLQGGAAYAPVGWKFRLIPARLRNHSSPWAIVAIGVLFATVFDTATQASAWGYVASNRAGGMIGALLAGLVFTVGMIITDTIDSRIIVHINTTASGQEIGYRYRRGLGWLVVTISYAMAGYNISVAFMPGLELEELAFSLTGFALLMVMVLIWAYAWRSQRALRSGASQRSMQRDP